MCFCVSCKSVSLSLQYLAICNAVIQRVFGSPDPIFFRKYVVYVFMNNFRLPVTFTYTFLWQLIVKTGNLEWSNPPLMLVYLGSCHLLILTILQKWRIFVYFNGDLVCKWPPTILAHSASSFLDYMPLFWVNVNLILSFSLCRSVINKTYDLSLNRSCDRNFKFFDVLDYLMFHWELFI